MICSGQYWKHGRQVFVGLIILGATFLMISTSAATIINVPGDYSTIQEGINASSGFDTVLVAPGHYFENVNFNGKEIVLTSHFMFEHNTSYIFNTIIDGSNQSHPDTGSTVLLVNYEGVYTKLQGFTITGGTGTLFQWSPGYFDRNGGGVFLLGSSATVQYNYIYGNKSIDADGIYSAGGGGIRVEYGGPSILNNVIVHNEGHYGAGIAIGYCEVDIKNNVIAYNTGGAKYSGSGIQINQGGPILIENNTIVGNISPLKGSAIKVFNAAPTIHNNIIWYNQGLFPAVDGYSAASYCNVEGGYLTGTGNINVEPHLVMNDWLYPFNDSPDIDAGDPNSSSFDIENPASVGSANWPSFGGLRNDMGAYGGPDAFPFHPTMIYHDSSVGFIPLNISFEAYSAQNISDWTWDFDDGDSAFVQNVTHLFETPGQHDVVVQAVAVSGDTTTYTQVIYALADTIQTDNIEVNVSDANEVEVIINITNNAPLKEITVPVEYSGALALEFVSYNTTGCRTESYSGIELTADTASKTLVFDIKSQLESPEYLPAGSGPIIVIVFKVVSWTTGTTTIALDGYDTTSPTFTGDGFDYAPVVINGDIIISYLCGDANGDGSAGVGDAVYLINYAFRGGPAPQPMESGDANSDGASNVADAVYLISYVFRGGPAPCEFAS